jgi:hypothetical protein
MEKELGPTKKEVEAPISEEITPPPVDSGKGAVPASLSNKDIITGHKEEGMSVKPTKEIKEKLESLRKALRDENISTGELAELQGLAKYIDPGDVELLEAAGVPEFPEDKEGKAKGALKVKKADYQGWKNYETWTVALLIDNDRTLYDEVQSVVNSHKGEAWELGDSIKEIIERDNPLDGVANVYSQLLSGAISEVDFREIAQSLLGDKAENDNYQAPSPSPKPEVKSETKPDLGVGPASPSPEKRESLSSRIKKAFMKRKEAVMGTVKKAELVKQADPIVEDIKESKPEPEPEVKDEKVVSKDKETDKKPVKKDEKSDKKEPKDDTTKLEKAVEKVKTDLEKVDKEVAKVVKDESPVKEDKPAKKEKEEVKEKKDDLPEAIVELPKDSPMPSIGDDINIALPGMASAKAEVKVAAPSPEVKVATPVETIAPTTNVIPVSPEAVVKKEVEVVVVKIEPDSKVEPKTVVAPEPIAEAAKVEKEVKVASPENKVAEVAPAPIIPVKTEAELKAEADAKKIAEDKAASEKAELEAKVKETEAKLKAEQEKSAQDRMKASLEAKKVKIDAIVKEMMSKGLITASAEDIAKFQKEGAHLLDARNKAFKLAMDAQKASLFKMDKFSIQAFEESILKIQKVAGVTPNEFSIINNITLDKSAGSDDNWMNGLKWS